MHFETAKPPDWVSDLIGAVAAGFHPEVVCGPLGYIWIPPKDQMQPWRLSVFPTPGEIAEAGPEDGEITVPGFRLTLTPILKKFSPIPRVDWRAPSQYTGELDGPGVVIRGRVHGRRLILSVFDEPPAAFKPTVIFDRIRGKTRLRPNDTEEE